MATSQRDGDAYTSRKKRNLPINLPAVVVSAIVMMVFIFIAQEYFLGARINADVWNEFGFVPARYAHGELGMAGLWSPVSYSLLHGSWGHILFNSLWLAIFGAPVARRIGAMRFLLLWFGSAIASAFFYAATDWGAEVVLIGASGVVSAYMGAACRFVFSGGGGFSPHAHLNPRLSITEVFGERTASAFILIWFIGNVLVAFGVSFAGVGESEIAWQAHIGGFLFGFLAFPMFDVKTPRVLRF